MKLVFVFYVHFPLILKIQFFTRLFVQNKMQFPIIEIIKVLYYKRGL